MAELPKDKTGTFKRGLSMSKGGKIKSTDHSHIGQDKKLRDG
jgi:hypothetical protein